MDHICKSRIKTSNEPKFVDPRLTAVSPLFKMSMTHTYPAGKDTSAVRVNIYVQFQCVSLFWLVLGVAP